MPCARRIQPNPAVLYAAYHVYTDLASDARLQYQKALEADPKLPGIHFELGELPGISDDAKTKAAAESEYQAATAENQMDEKAEWWLGDLSSHKGDPARAIEHYNATEARIWRARHGRSENLDKLLSRSLPAAILLDQKTRTA